MLPGIKQFNLQGKSAIITGGSKGLGEAIAAGLASAGADVLLTSRHQAEAENAAAQIAADFGHRAVGLAADVIDSEQVQSMVDRAITEFGKIDVLINNAGINFRGPIDELTYEQFREVQDVNVNALLSGSRFSHEKCGVGADYQYGQHAGTGRPGESNALRRQQGRRRAVDASTGARTGPAQHPLQRDMPRTVSHPDEYPCCRR